MANKRHVYFGAIPYDAPDGIHRLAYQGDEVTLTKADEERLDGIGALYPKSYDPADAAEAAAAEAQAPRGVSSELTAAREAVALRDGVISELQDKVALLTEQRDTALAAAPPRSTTPGAKTPADEKPRPPRPGAEKPDKPSTKASAAKAAKEEQAGTAAPIASDPFDPASQTPPVKVDPETGLPAEQ